MLSVIVIHLSQTILLLLHIFELLLSMNYLYFSVFIDKKQNIDILFLFLMFIDALLSKKFILIIILLICFLSIISMVSKAPEIA